MKYEVKYLEQDEIRFGDSKIYIDKPIYSEYKNIKIERSELKTHMEEVKESLKRNGDHYRK